MGAFVAVVLEFDAAAGRLLVAILAATSGAGAFVLSGSTTYRPDIFS